MNEPSGFCMLSTTHEHTASRSLPVSESGERQDRLSTGCYVYRVCARIEVARDLSTFEEVVAVVAPSLLRHCFELVVTGSLGIFTETNKDVARVEVIHP